MDKEELKLNTFVYHVTEEKEDSMSQFDDTLFYMPKPTAQILMNFLLFFKLLYRQTCFNDYLQ
jgi:hypothetical protein